MGHSAALSRTCLAASTAYSTAYPSLPAAVRTAREIRTIPCSLCGVPCGVFAVRRECILACKNLPARGSRYGSRTHWPSALSLYLLIAAGGRAPDSRDRKSVGEGTREAL